MHSTVLLVQKYVEFSLKLLVAKWMIVGMSTDNSKQYLKSRLLILFASHL